MATGLRVLEVAQSYPRHANDPHGSFVATHVEALCSAGAAVGVLAPSMPGTRPSPGVVRFRYGPRRWEVLAGTGAMHHAVRGPAGLLLPGYLASNVAAVRRLAPSVDIVHAHWWVPTGLACVLGSPVPVVVHLHGTDAAVAPAGSHRARLARWVLRRADAVLAASSDLANWAWDVAQVRATVAPMPLDPTKLAEPSPAPADGPLLVVGRLVPEKGIDVAVAAAARVGRRLVVVGEGPERPRLEELGRATGAEVRFAGAVAPAALPDLYRQARLVVVPSRREGFGLVAAEALASGRAVVASRVGGLTDIVTDGVNGMLVPPDDVEALAAALDTVDPVLGEAGPACVERWSPARVAARDLAIYDEVLTRRGSR